MEHVLSVSRRAVNLMATLLLSCGLTTVPTVKAAEKPEGKEESRVKHDAGGEAVVTLDAATQQRIGLKLDTLAAAALSPEIKGYGRVVDPAPLAALVAEIMAAQVALEASQRDLEQAKRFHESEMAAAEAAAKSSRQELSRAQTLFKENNTSQKALQLAEAAAKKDHQAVESQKVAATRAVQAAESAFRRDKIAVDAISQKLVNAWGPAIARQNDLPGFARSLVALETALVRIDLPAGETLEGPPKSARVISVARGSTPVDAAFLETAPNADPQSQGQGFLFLLKPNSARLVPGLAVTGHLAVPGQPQSGALVPRAAVVRVNGQPWVYVRTGDGAFTRREIALDHPLANGWFVTRGVIPGDRVVVAAAQVLLSEELKGQIDKGD